MGFTFSCWLNPVMRLYSRSKILPALLISGARCHLWSVQMYVRQWHCTPKGSQAPVKVNSHHLNLSAPPINSNSCQKLRWMRTVHGWVAFDEMWVVECITKCQHVFSWIQPCQLHTGNERLPLHGMCSSERLKDITSGYDIVSTLRSLNVQKPTQLSSNPEVVK